MGGCTAPTQVALPLSPLARTNQDIAKVEANRDLDPVKKAFLLAALKKQEQLLQARATPQ